MRSYDAARNLFSFFSTVSWIAVLIGGIIAVVGMSAISQFRTPTGWQLLAAVSPGLIFAGIGLVCLAVAQMGRANVDVAEYSQQMLQLSRDQLEVSKQVLAQGKQVAPSFSTNATAATAAAVATNDADNQGASFANRRDASELKGDANQTSEIAAQSTPAALSEPPLETPVSELLAAAEPATAKELIFEDGLYKYDKMTFKSRERAEAYLEHLGINFETKLPST